MASFRLSCKHVVAFITSLSNGQIRYYVDLYYSIEKFSAAYVQLIPAMPNKTQWPKYDHGFFIHPPLLKATADRPKTERYKGWCEKKRKNGKHLCPICKDWCFHFIESLYLLNYYVEVGILSFYCAPFLSVYAENAITKDQSHTRQEGPNKEQIWWLKAFKVNPKDTRFTGIKKRSKHSW